MSTYCHRLRIISKSRPITVGTSNRDVRFPGTWDRQEALRVGDLRAAQVGVTTAARPSATTDPFLSRAQEASVGSASAPRAGPGPASPFECPARRAAINPTARRSAPPQRRSATRSTVRRDAPRRPGVRSPHRHLHHCPPPSEPLLDGL